MGVKADQTAMNWISNLVAEANRDLVFMWHITSGRFSTPPGVAAPSEKEIDEAISRLIEIGARVGFGDPDLAEFTIPAEILVNGKPCASIISELRHANPTEYEFLVFAVRNPAAQPYAAADHLRRPLS